MVSALEYLHFHTGIRKASYRRTVHAYEHSEDPEIVAGYGNDTAPILGTDPSRFRGHPREPHVNLCT